MLGACMLGACMLGAYMSSFSAHNKRLILSWSPCLSLAEVTLSFELTSGEIDQIMSCQ